MFAVDTEVRVRVAFRAQRGRRHAGLKRGFTAGNANQQTPDVESGERDPGASPPYARGGMI